MFLDFTGKYRNQVMTKHGNQNLPHMKRIINNQVFLEESEPLSHDLRRNIYAMEAGNSILNAQQNMSGLYPGHSPTPDGGNSEMFQTNHD